MRAPRPAHPFLTLFVAVTLLTSILAGSTARGSSLPHWIVVSGFGPGVTINDVEFLDDQVGWAAGDGGALFATEDGGRTWRPVSSAATADLRRVRFTDVRHGYVAGGSVLLRTADGGATWQPLISPSLPAGIQDLGVPDASTLILAAAPAGSPGGIYRSADGGATWQLAAAASAGLGFSRLAFPGATNGWATGTAGLYRTTDGGQNWTQVDAHLVAYQALSFPSPSLGFVGGIIQSSTGGWSAAVGRTGDGGTTWSISIVRSASQISLADARALAFTPDGRMGLAAVGTSLYESEDGGLTWQRQSLPKGDGAALTTVGFRDGDPYAIADGLFLHHGALPPLATATGTSVAPAAALTATVTIVPVVASVGSATGTPSGAEQVPFATATPFEARTRLAFPTATPIVLRITGISPSVAVAGSGIRLTVAGVGFDALATVTIGDVDITAVHTGTAARLSFALPAALRPGIYGITLVEPDGSTSVLGRALTIEPRLTIRARLLHPWVRQGGTVVVLAQTLPAAAMRTSFEEVTGSAALHAHIVQQHGPRGQWRMLLAIDPRLLPGRALVRLTARWAGQQASVGLPLQIVPGPSPAR